MAGTSTSSTSAVSAPYRITLVTGELLTDRDEFLDYGYAYAEEIMCEGQDLITMTGGWLTGEELAQLDRWLYDRAALTVDNNYVNGQGTQAMSEAEQAEINSWAMNLYTRISGTGAAVAPAADAQSCPEAAPDLAIVRDCRRSFCLLVPATHTVFDTNPDEITIAKESLLNVTDPRLQIAVTPAEGRDAEKFADALVAELAGFEIARSTATIAGQPAVVLDNVPDQDLSRRVLIAHNDRLYDLTFSPLSNAEIEDFYTTIIAHLVLVEPE